MLLEAEILVAKLYIPYKNKLTVIIIPANRISLKKSLVASPNVTISSILVVCLRVVY